MRPPLSAALGVLVDQVWGPIGGCSPVRVVAAEPPPADMRVRRRYLALPSQERARVMLPADSAAAVSAALCRFNALRPRAMRLTRRAVASGLRTGLVRGSPLAIAVPTALPEHELAEWLPEAWLASVLDVPEVLMSAGVHAVSPNQKPVLELFDAAGAAIGHGKVGWNAATAARIRCEVGALRSVRGLRQLQVPRVLHHGTWRDREIAVVEPLPDGVRRLPSRMEPPIEAAVDIALADGVRTVMLAESRYWRQLRRRITLARADLAHTEFGAVLDRLADWVERRWGRDEFRFGRWHGDWVPWNMARRGSELWVWDWEHAGTDVPIGFDQVHWHFQTRLVRTGAGLAAAVDHTFTRAEPTVRAMLGALVQPRAIVSLYLLEIALRHYELRRGSGQWRRDFYPAALTVLPALAVV